MKQEIKALVCNGAFLMFEGREQNRRVVNALFQSSEDYERKDLPLSSLFSVINLFPKAGTHDLKPSFSPVSNPAVL